ncbi:MAG: GNA1162 family protein [Planctomycetota bacterium]
MMRFLPLVALALVATACNSGPPPIKETFIQSRPRSILVLPPLDESIEAGASWGALSTVTYPLAENGYYVFPAALVTGMMRENGLPTPFEMHQVSLAKLYEVFGMDAVLYLTVTDWGTSYQVLSSSTRISIEGRLVDARTGDLLWAGSETAVQSSGSGGSLIGSLIGAAVNQVATAINDPSRDIAAAANNNLLRGARRGWLYGPYHPQFDQQLDELTGVASNAP